MAGRASRCFLLASSELNPQRTTALCYPDSQVPYCRLANSVVDMILLLSRPQAPLLALINQQFAKVQKLSNTGWGSILLLSFTYLCNKATIMAPEMNPDEWRSPVTNRGDCRGTERRFERDSLRQFISNLDHYYFLR